MSGHSAPTQGTYATATAHEPVAALPAPQTHAALPAPGQAGGPKPSGNAGGTVRKLLILLIILAAVGGAIWKIRQNRAETAAQPVGRPGGGGGGGPIPVLVSPVAQRTVPVYLTALGTVTAYNSVTIKSRVDGQLLSVNVREGQAVKKGQLLAEIDPRPYQAVVAQAEGQLAKDQATAANATAEANRYTALYGAGVISKESQQAQISNAGQATGAIQADQAAIQAAKVNVTYTRITSPIDGIVGLRTVDPGNIVHASDATGLILVTQVHPIAVIFTLPEDQLPQVLKLSHSGVKLVVDAYDRSETQHLATGTLLTVDNQIDTTTGTAKIKAVFPNTDNALFPNQFVNVRLILEQRQNALVVPSAALQTATSGNFVYVVRQGDPPAGLASDNGSTGTRGGKGRRAGGGAAGTPGPNAGTPPAEEPAGAAGGEGGRQAGPHYYAEAVPVKVDLTQGSNTVLGSGVNPGDELVIDGQEKLKNGARVIPKQADAGAGRGSAGNGSTALSGPGRHAQTGDATGPQGAPRAGANGQGDSAQGTAGRQP
jgi:multidrug efflux system membrane fusion protein